MLDEQIKHQLKQHHTYLNTNRELGKPAMFLNSVLNGFDFSGIDLTKVNFNFADMRCCNFFGTNLTDTKLDRADLTGAQHILRWQAPLGSRRMCYSVNHGTHIMHKLGCFWGDTPAAINHIRKKYGDDSVYEQTLLIYSISLTRENQNK